MTSEADAAPHRTGPRWGAPAVWNLIWLSYLLYQPLLGPTNPLRDWAVVAVIVVVFVPVYLESWCGRGRLRGWAPVLITGLAVVTIPLNAGASVLCVYTAGLVGNARPRRPALRWFAALSLLLVIYSLVLVTGSPWQLLSFVPSLILVWVLGMASVAAADQRRATRFHNAQVEHLATLSERERISRDLHDLLGQTLTGIIARAQLAQRLTGADADAAATEMAAVEDAARAALTEVRATVSGWRHVDLDDELAVAQTTLTAAGVTLTVTREPGPALTPSAETALSLALREAVTNVVRHAHATRCAVALRHTGGRVVLEVSDDGVGGASRDGNGLTGMRERIAALGGDVERRSRGGTAVTVAVPT